MRKLFVLNLLFIAFFWGCLMQNQALPKPTADVIDAEKGQLDLNLYDVPYDEIEKQQINPDYPTDSHEVQMQKYKIMNEILQSQKAQEEVRKQQALSNLDSMINDFNTVKQQYDDSRKSYNPNVYPYYPYYQDPSTYSTNPSYYPYNHYPIPYYPLNSWGYQPYINMFTFPNYPNKKESAYDGIDNNNNGFIDEGYNNGNLQIVLGDTGTVKEDVFNLYVDGKFVGANTAGKTRNWDLYLTPGTHKVSITGSIIPDKSGTYSIVFRKAQVLSGPPLAGENLFPGATLTWTIRVR